MYTAEETLSVVGGTILIPTNWKKGSTPIRPDNSKQLIPPSLIDIANTCWAFNKNNPQIYIYAVSDIWVVVDIILREMFVLGISKSCIRKGIIKVTINSNQSIDIILKIFSSIDEILDSFINPIEAMVYSNGLAFESKIAKFSMENFAIIVRPSIDDKYLKIITKLAENGYALVFPNLDSKALIENETITVGSLVIKKLTNFDNVVIGTIEYKKPKLDTFWRRISEDLYLFIFTGDILNVISVLKGDDSHTFILNELTVAKIKSIRRQDLVDSNVLANSLRVLTKDSTVKDNLLNLTLLQKVFQMTLPETYELISLINSNETKLKEIFLEKKVNEIVLKFTSDVSALEWISEKNNSAEVKSLEFYGDHYITDVNNIHIDYLQIIKFLNSKRWDIPTGVVFNTECAFCMEPISRGESNSAILSCGHIFHLSSLNKYECGGMQQYSVDYSTCPICKKPLQS